MISYLDKFDPSAHPMPSWRKTKPENHVERYKAKMIRLRAEKKQADYAERLAQQEREANTARIVEMLKAADDTPERDPELCVMPTHPIDKAWAGIARGSYTK